MGDYVMSIDKEKEDELTKKKALNVGVATPLELNSTAERRKRPKEHKPPMKRAQLDDFYNDDDRAIYAMQGIVADFLAPLPALSPWRFEKLIRQFGFDPSFNTVLGRWEDHGYPAQENLKGKIMGCFMTVSQFVPAEYKPTFSNRAIIGDVIEDSIYDNPIDPIKSYFQNGLLPQYLRYSPFDVLCDHIEDRNNVARPFLKRFLLGCVARALDGYQNHTLILHGNQGLGKSTFVKWLCSSLPEYFQEGPIDPSDKDHKIRLGSKFLWAADEFEVPKGNRGISQLKEFLTLAEINERRPYARHAHTQKRHCSIVGTTNKSNFLTDPTGNRRFLIINLRVLARGYMRIKVDDLWAEVLGWYRAGERPDLTETERKMQRVTNAESEAPDALEEFLKAKVKQVAGFQLPFKTLDEEVASSEEAKSFNQKTGCMQKTHELMRKLGFDEKRINTGNIWLNAKLMP